MRCMVFVKATNDSENGVIPSAELLAGVEGEYRIGLGQIADRSGDRLRMDAILASRRIRLRV